MTAALVTWGAASAWFSDARDADVIADVLRRGTDTVTVKVVDWSPAECEEAIDRAIDALDTTRGESVPAHVAAAIQKALDALEGV